MINFILDVDGVLTTGHFLYSIDGKSYKIFGAHDSDGLKLIRDKVHIEFISADKRGFEITKKRIVDDMGYSLTLVSENDRYEYVKEKWGLNNLIFMGDGYHDAPLVKDAMCGIAPQNARKEVRAVADYITESNSGEGAVMDACLYIKEKFLD